MPALAPFVRARAFALQPAREAMSRAAKDDVIPRATSGRDLSRPYTLSRPRILTSFGVAGQ